MTRPARSLFLALIVLLAGPACSGRSPSGVRELLDVVGAGGAGLDTGTIVAGLKEALHVGTKKEVARELGVGVRTVRRKGSFFKQRRFHDRADLLEQLEDWHREVNEEWPSRATGEIPEKRRQE